MDVIFFVFLYDLILKEIATEKESHALVSIYPVKNTGAGISILEGHNSILLIINLASIFMLFYLYESFPSQYILLTIGGVAGNLYDRYAYHGVRDFLYFRGLFICNLADICIFIGLFSFFFFLRFQATYYIDTIHRDRYRFHIWAP